MIQTFQFLFEIPAYQAHRHPQMVAGALWKQGIKKEVSSNELARLTQSISAHLLRLNIHKGDRVMLYSETYSVQWLAIDMAIMAVGAISVPLHHPTRDAELKLISDNIKPALVIVRDDTLWPEIVAHAPKISFENILSLKNETTTEEIQALEAIRSSLTPDDTATIVHTSGSSGEPRAVCLSHQNVTSNVMAVLSLVPFTPGTRVISFLPLSHIFERIVCYVYLACGVNIYFLESYRYALWALKDVKPEYFTSVPLVLERFASILEDRIEEMSWFTRWAYRSWEKTDRGFFSHIGSLIAHQWIIKRWKRSMGGRLKGIVSGAAYLDPQVEKLYERSGIKIRQGYGLTEASPVVAINRFEPGGYRRGTVGMPLPGVMVRIAEDGEVLVKGPNVMKGYYLDEVSTQSAIRDGWLHTGDIGRWEKDHFLIIHDRKSNIYKHASGKFIAPARIESVLDHHPLIHQAMIIGFQKPFTVALIIPHFDHLQKICAAHHIHWTAPEYMIHNTRVIELYREILDHLDLQSHERIEKFILLADAWSPENGLLTATYKPRRKDLLLKYSKDVEAMFE